MPATLHSIEAWLEGIIRPCDRNDTSTIRLRRWSWPLALEPLDANAGAARDACAKNSEILMSDKLPDSNAGVATGRRRQPARNSARTLKPDQQEEPHIASLARLHLDKPSFPIPSPQRRPSKAHTLSGPGISAATNPGGAAPSEWDLASTPSMQTDTNDAISQAPASGGGRKDRSRSPVKSPLDLQFSAKHLRYEAVPPATLSDDDRALIRDLNKISAVGHGTIPSSLRQEIQDAAGELDEIEPWMLADDGRSIELLGGELKHVKDVLLYSVDCDEMEMSEAAWNTDVHMPLLRLALEGFPTLRACNVYVFPSEGPFQPGIAYTY